MKLCFCNGCDCLLEDMNPQTGAIEFPEILLPALIMIKDEHGNGWCCPYCNTDGYLMDIELRHIDMAANITEDQKKVFINTYTTNTPSKIKGIYFQPILLEGDLINSDFNSSMVYRSYDNAKRDFPNHNIGAYSGNDIENPTFIDSEETGVHVTTFTTVHPQETQPITGFEVRPFKIYKEDGEEDESVTSLGVTDAEADGFGIYANLQDGTQQWVADCPTREMAEPMAASLLNICQRFKKKALLVYDTPHQQMPSIMYTNAAPESIEIVQVEYPNTLLNGLAITPIIKTEEEPIEQLHTLYTNEECTSRYGKEIGEILKEYNF